MTEAWQLALFSGISAAFLTVLGWIAVELREMRKELREFVTIRQCADDMAEHCSRLQELQRKIEDNEASIKFLSGQASVWHGSKK